MVQLSQFHLLLLVLGCSMSITAARTKTNDCSYKMDLTFVVDSSGSICGDNQVTTCDNWKDILAFVHRLVNEMPIGDNDVKVALIDSYARPKWNLTTFRDKSSLLNAIDTLPYTGGNKNTIAALDLLSTFFTLERGDRPDVRNTAILITHGNQRIGSDPYPMDEIRAAVKRVTDQNIQLLAVGVSDGVDMDTLKKLSSPPHKVGETVFVAEDYQTLQTVLGQQENENCKKLWKRTANDAPHKHCDFAMDLALVIDSSGSICDDKDVKTCDNWELILSFIKHLINDMIIGDNEVRVAMIEFESSPWLKWDLRTYHDKSALLKAIDNLRYTGGNTNTIAALDMLSTVFSAERGDRPGTGNTAILITDGKPRRGSDPYPMNEIRDAVKRVTDQDIRLLAVGVTDSIDTDTLKELSSPPHKENEQVFVAATFQDLENILKQLEYQTCKTTDKLYDPPKASCTEKLDLCFVVDASGSICDTDEGFNYHQDTTCNNWKRNIHFIHSITDYFDIGLQTTRVGLVIISSTSTVRWNLNAFQDRQSLLNAIDSLVYQKGGTTDMTGGLRLMRKEVFGLSGDRPDVPNAAVIITDGYPTDPSTLPAEIDAVRQSGIRMLAVGVTNKTDENTIRMLASPPQKINENYFMALDFFAIESVRKALQEKICQPSR